MPRRFDPRRHLARGAARAAAALAALLAGATAHAADGERIRVTGELIDTWCYFSGVMGGPDAVTGSAHHTCAMWCASGGIPVGLLAEDGTVYMVLKWQGSAEIGDAATMLSLQSHEVVADGIHYARDGIDYLMVEEVVADNGIQNRNHEDFGVVPGFAIPEPAAQ